MLVPMALLATAIAAAAAAPPPEAPPAVAPGSPSRVLRGFDFEEAEAAPHEMPIHFYRVPAAEEGFPPFGRLRLSREAPHGGHWSFEMELEGGSLAARVPAGVLPVMPGADYVVDAWVRTEGLRHARARIAAAMFDASGNPVAAGRVAGPLMETGGEWVRTSVEVSGADDRATGLVLELQVLQPAQYLRSGEQEGRPRLQDLAGRVWFDDVVIRQRPRIELATSSPGNVFEPGEPLALRIMVRDFMPGPLTAELRVEDCCGAVVREERFEPARGTWRTALDFAGLDAGWYRAVLEVSDGREVIGTRTVSAVILSGSRRAAGAASGTRFGVVVPPAAMAGDARTTGRLIGGLGARSAVLPAGSAAGSAEVRQVAHDLRAAGIEPILALTEPPAGMSGAVLDLLAREPERFEELLSGSPIGSGLEAPRWLIGTPGDLEAVPQPRLGELLSAARRAVERSAPASVVLVPFRAEDEPVDLPPGFGHWFSVSCDLRPEALEQHAARWPLERGPLGVTLEPAPAGQHPPRQRMADLAMRMLHGWRAGLPLVAIEAPWTCSAGPPAEPMPDPAYVVWRSVSDRLAGRSFGGELPVGEGLRCWIVNGPPGEASALVAWNERAGPAGSTLRILLADGPVEVVDSFGNSRRVERGEDGHEIPLDELPVFIEGADHRLARFRSSLAFSPARIPAGHQLHECVAVLENPWDFAISGSIRYEPPPGWSISPRAQPFSIPAGSRAELPVSMRPRRGAIAGPALVEAAIDLAAGRDFSIRAQAALEVGIDSIEFAAHWRAEGGDLVVTQIVTNAGDRPLEVQGYVSAPEIPQQRRPFPVLAPGGSAVRTFTLLDGVHLLAGRRIRAGVTERNGPARVETVLEIFVTAPSTASPPARRERSRSRE